MLYSGEKELVEDIISKLDEIFYNETDNKVAEGIDKAGSVVRQMYRKICVEGGNQHE